MSRWPDRVLHLALGVAFTLFFLAVAEAVMRRLREPPGYVALNPREDPLYLPHPSRGYTLKPGVHHQYTTPQLSVSIDISSDGLRDTTIAEARRARYRVLSIGDSFTMGLAVEARDAWSERLEHLLQAGGSRSASVVNTGVPGYGPRQIHQRLGELLPLVQPDAVVYGLTAETYTRMLTPIVLYGGTLVRADALPGLRVDGHGLLYSPFRRSWLRAADLWLNQHFQLAAHVLDRARLIYLAFRPGSAGPPDPRSILDSVQIHRDMQPALDELVAMHREVAARHVRFVAVLINMQRPDGGFRPQDGIYNAIITGVCRREGIECIDMLPVLRNRASGLPVFRTPQDQHWTPAAHALAAEEIYRRLASGGP